MKYNITQYTVWRVILICGVLIFVIFMIDLAVTKFYHPQKLMRVSDDGCGQNIVAAQPTVTLPSVSKLRIYCHPANGIFDTNYSSISSYLSTFLQIWLSNEEELQRNRACIRVHHHLCHVPGLVAITKFKIN